MKAGHGFEFRSDAAPGALSQVGHFSFDGAA
jgi:hypothetical protein